MGSLLQTKVLSARVEFVRQNFKTPLRLSSGLIEAITEARAHVRVRCGEHEAEGIGSIYLSDLWSWPDPSRTHEQRDAALRELCERIAQDLPSIVGEEAHPLELGIRLHHAALHWDSPAPALARSLCASPFDAAIHDAVGRALGVSAFSFYKDPVAIPSADAYFPGGACRAIAQALQEPADSLAGWWIINSHDSLDGDFAQAIRERGYGCFKIKLLGKDSDADAGRTAAVYRAALRHGIVSPRISCDSNEGNPDAESVRSYLETLRALDLEAYDAVCYLEQPTSRDIRAASFDWHPVSQLKPVLLDEGLTSLDLLPLAIEQGWTGLALKTCKGHSFTLVAAAWAKQQGLLLAMQDLTNPGFAAVHSYLVAAHLPVINGIELNSPQFTPQANEDWLPKYRELFEPKDGQHRVSTIPVGLGTSLE